MPRVTGPESRNTGAGGIPAFGLKPKFALANFHKGSAPLASLASSLLSPRRPGETPSGSNPLPLLISRKVSSRPQIRIFTCSTVQMLKCSVGQRPTGAGGIRTPGTFRYNGFQDRRLKPLGHCSKSLLTILYNPFGNQNI